MRNSILFSILFLSCAFFANAQPEVILETYATGFSSPVDITHAGDDRLFIVERAGLIKIIDANGTTLATPFLDIDNLVHSFGGQGEIGLLGLAFHPNFANNGHFYVHYTNNDDNSSISRFTVDAGSPNTVDPATEQIVMVISQPYLNHNGGCLKFGPDGYLYIGMGDGGSAGDPQNYAQNTNSMLGKMLRIDVDNGSPYSIPANNPFVNDANVLDEIWAIGLRNPWRFSFDRMTGDLWIGDVGQGAREEIDLQPASSNGGENYGWRCYEGDNSYNTSGCGPAGDYVGALHDYNHSGGSCSVTGGFVYRGSDQPALSGIYIYADYCSGRIWTLSPDGSGSYDDNLSNTYGGYDLSSFGEDTDGELYAARLGTGTIYKVTADACSAFAANATIVNETCAATNDGSISISLSDGTSPYTYAWSTGDNTSSISGLQAGTYIVTINDAAQCQLIETYQLTNGTPSNFTVMANGPTEFCEGDSVVLTSDTPPAGYDLQWNNGNLQIPGANDITYTVFGNPGNYYVTFLNGPCSVPSTSNWIFVNVLETPDDPVATLDGPEILCPGEFTTISTDAAPANYGYQWYKGTELLAGETNMGIIIGDPGSYYVVYTGECETNTSNWIEITMDNMAAPVITEIDNTLASDDVYAAYQWYLDGAPIFEANMATYEATESGDYYLEVMSDNDCLYTSNMITITITSVFPVHHLTGVEVSPNPFDDQLVLNIEVSESADLQILVHDVKGVEQYQDAILVGSKLKKEIKLGHLASGIYFLSIQSGDRVYTKKIIRN